MQSATHEFKVGDRVRCKPGKADSPPPFDLNPCTMYTVMAVNPNSIEIRPTVLPMSCINPHEGLRYRADRFELVQKINRHYLIQVGLTPWTSTHPTIEDAVDYAVSAIADGGEFSILEVRTIRTYRVSKPQPQPEAIPV